jgi:hypothetical protein
MNPIEKAIREALVELRGKTLHQVQVETAYKWAGRACAASMMGQHDDAEEYAHEAIEHAALSGDDRLLGAVRAAMRGHGVALPGL